MSEQIQRRNHHDWPRLCERVGDEGCEAALTEVDQTAGYCTNCRKPITESENDDE